MSTSSITFITIFRLSVTRHVIFNQIEEISNQISQNQQQQQQQSKRKRNESRKGKEIIKLKDFAMIADYAMPWDFIKHYLPAYAIDQDGFQPRLKTISRYCRHPNATLSTLEHLLEWSPDYHPNKEKDIPKGTNQACRIAKAGHTDILELLVKRYPKMDLEFSMSSAIKRGHLSTIQFLNTCKRVRCSTFQIDYAAKFGRFDILKFLHENRTEGCTVNALDNAASNGHLDIVKFLHENRTEGCTKKAMDESAKNGYIEILKFLHLNRTEGCTTNAMDFSVISGRTDIVKFLNENRTEGCTNFALTVNPTDSDPHFETIHYILSNKLINSFMIQKLQEANSPYYEIIRVVARHFNTTYHN
ncbi:hypothetical protein DFA_01926 [Cavenderia fasciculata]|uniref:Ankyrin repeat-containing protein n=1 Tax=Cavenderia fasciculata TaxID=261658 RepID=F4PQS9_CACFS|nr:uncharacterized protein DFA_01926 [Cavenderia fasciculata]EGG22037.1 hypothetical protein DFA_01926 [Cavenderia fasciculata]|eukprot:XP_004359888.1 hypothetical protein DFA_01926 [Cavenderia fasciculata]